MAKRTAADTRAELLAAAAGLFRERGYAGVSVRDIAAAVGKDPSLVIRHFGSKEALFLKALHADVDLTWLAPGTIEDLGVRLVRAVIDGDERVRGIFLSLIRASDADGVSTRLRQVHDEALVAPLRAALPGPDAELRARLAAAMLGGLLYSFWIVGDAPLAAADREDVIRRYGAALQRVLTA